MIFNTIDQQRLMCPNLMHNILTVTSNHYHPHNSTPATSTLKNIYMYLCQHRTCSILFLTHSSFDPEIVRLTLTPAISMISSSVTSSDPFSLDTLCRKVMAFLISPSLTSTILEMTAGWQPTPSALAMCSSRLLRISSVRGLKRNLEQREVNGSIILSVWGCVYVCVYSCTCMCVRVCTGVSVCIFPFPHKEFFFFYYKFLKALITIRLHFFYASGFYLYYGGGGGVGGVGRCVLLRSYMYIL